jgi:hypothetical protein
MMRFKDMVAIINGGTSGMGRAAALGSRPFRTRSTTGGSGRSNSFLGK